MRPTACYFVQKQTLRVQSFFITSYKTHALRRPRRSMATNRPLYDYISDVERLDGYRPGGYHPIQLNDKLHGRYSVTEKLGYGTYSTIWLARDENQSRYVAIKIGIADYTSKEAHILEQLSAHPTNDLNDSLIAPVLDHFELKGPNGTRSCLVTTPARCSLVHSLDDYDLFPLDVARSLAAQLVMAVARVHSSGIVHGGESLRGKCLEILLISIRHSPRQLAPPIAKRRDQQAHCSRFL